MQKLSLKNLSAGTAENRSAVFHSKAERAGQALSEVIFGVNDNEKSSHVVELFLNISLKRFYTVMFKGCLAASRGRNPERASRYKKIYSMITLYVPGAEKMTIGQFLRYIDVNCMKRCGPEGPEDMDTKQYLQNIKQGKYLAKLFFIDTFEPMLRTYKLDKETIISKLCT